MSRHHIVPASPSPHLACPLTRLPSQHLPHAVLLWHVPLALKALHAARLSLLAARVTSCTRPCVPTPTRSCHAHHRRCAFCPASTSPQRPFRTLVSSSSRCILEVCLGFGAPTAHRAVSMSHGPPSPNTAPLNVSSLSSLPALLVHELSERCATAAHCVSTLRSRNCSLPLIHSINPFASYCASALFPPLPPSTYTPITCCCRTSIVSAIRHFSLPLFPSTQQ
ncbi:hypothetical protein B0H14DRAFT_3521849 [Mycena olivaceomarginata]|nr:hypothetical protein B0H14DRAFT_3521849 [Mycena olivaceomarginata]